MDLGACKESDMTEQLSIAQHRIKWKCFKSRTSDIKVEKWGGVYLEGAYSKFTTCEYDIKGSDRCHFFHLFLLVGG